jgi:hypothetical protein
LLTDCLDHHLSDRFHQQTSLLSICLDNNRRLLEVWSAVLGRNTTTRNSKKYCCKFQNADGLYRFFCNFKFLVFIPKPPILFTANERPCQHLALCSSSCRAYPTQMAFVPFIQTFSCDRKICGDGGPFAQSAHAVNLSGAR